jgi:hypothetical protein
MAALERADVPVEISTLPSEVPDPIPFPEDTAHARYDDAAVTRFWRTLLGVEAVLREYRGRFRGKTPPVQLWWGSLDVAMSLYSGRPVATASGADIITRLGGDEEYFCGGFWPGDEWTPHAAFFAYMYPKPDSVERARWSNNELGEFVLLYDEVRESGDPRRTLLEFLDHAFDQCWTSENDVAEHVTH